MIEFENLRFRLLKPVRLKQRLKAMNRLKPILTMRLL